MGLFSFITAPIAGIVGSITGVVKASKTKAAAKIAAADAAKQRIHDAKMAVLAGERQAVKSKSLQTMLIVGGVLALVVILFIFKKR